jgi:predicted RNA-binding protein with PIN domain
MSYIIDGSNFLGRQAVSVRDAAEKMDLARRLSMFQRQTRARVTLVFDGPPDPGLETPPAPPGQRTLAVLFPAEGEKGDDLIMDIILKQKNPRHTVLVTSDRELAECGRELGLRIISVADFAKQLREALRDFHKARASRKRETKPPKGLELSLWLDVFKERR